VKLAFLLLDGELSGARGEVRLFDELEAQVKSKRDSFLRQDKPSLRSG
jgi:hypothetical protein